jgi:23S rRNA (uracil1939-C5)-methyltransferase
MLTTGLEVEKLVYGGDGLSRNEGRVILTPFVLKGERIDVEIEPVKQGVTRAKLIEVASPSADRVTPPCPHFGKCGGCHYQQISYEAQLKAKQEILRETLERVGKLKDLPPIAVIAGEPWGYRNRVQFHIENKKIGYKERGSHKLCAIHTCPISSPRINECITILNTMVKHPRWPKFIRSIELFTNETDVQLNVLETDQPIAGRFFEWCREQLPGVVMGALEYGEFRVSHGCFFQVNRLLVDKMVETAIGDAAGTTALDLYSGVGLFSLPLAKKFEKVTAVESGSAAVRDLEFNAKRAGVSIGAHMMNVDEFLLKREETVDFVLADPPRTGLGKTVTTRLTELAPKKIALVSCDPATLARDLSELSSYKIDSITLIDLFPQTFHVETVVQLSRGS